ncbi:MAG: hypothetical protein AB1384_05090 [Actinomycetota bacterium]
MKKRDLAQEPAAAPEEGAGNLSLELEGVDVPSIMRHIQERVEQRREQGVYRDLPIMDLEQEWTGGGDAEIGVDPLHELIFRIQMARQVAEVTSDYPIGARPSLLGAVILAVKKVIRRIMTPYMDAVFAKQREFNAQCLRSMEALSQMIIREREHSYHGGLDRYESWVELGFAQDEEELLREAARRFDAGRHITCIECGTGDFLAAAAKEGREAHGIEEDTRLVQMVQEKDLRVVQARALDYLEAQPLASLQAVFLRDLGERVDTRDLLWTISALADRVEGGGQVLVLNHHPRSVLGTEEAFCDPTLLRMVHPETMRELFLRSGFSAVEVSTLGDFGPQEIEEWKSRLEGAHLESGDLADLLFSPRRYLLEARR